MQKDEEYSRSEENLPVLILVAKVRSAVSVKARFSSERH